jgi:hypothetical protein
VRRIARSGYIRSSSLLGVDPTSGEYYHSVSAVTQAFNDQGYLSDDPIELLQGSLDYITTIKVWITDVLATAERTKNVLCLSDLLEDGVLVKE